LSFDFTFNNKAKAVAFGTKTAGEVYDHTKAICDRLKGSELMNIENVLVKNIQLVRYDLKNTNGQMEYAFSFVIGEKAGRANYTVQSNWLNKDYTREEVMYNIQLWAETPSLIISMADDIITRLSRTMPVHQIINANGIPTTYITKGKRLADNIVVDITNTTAGSNGYFEIKVKNNEQSTGYITKQIPFTINTNGKATVNVLVNDTYEAAISMYLNNKMVDQLFMADGNWALVANATSNSVKSFKIINDPKRVAESPDDYLLYRNVQLEANIADNIGIYKLVKGGGAPYDLSAYKSLLFKASATGVKMRITLVKESITNWADQYSLDIPLTNKSQDFIISLNDFVSSTNNAKIDPNDITTVIFTLINSTGRMTNMTTDISNVAFSKIDIGYLNSLKSIEVNVFPNPSNGRFMASFKSQKAETLVLTVREAASGLTIFTKSVNAQIGENTVPVNMERKVGLNGYILSLEGATIKYNPKKIFIE